MMQFKNIIIEKEVTAEITKIESITKNKRKYETQYIIDELNKIYDRMEDIDPKYVSLRRPKPLSSRKLQEYIN